MKYDRKMVDLFFEIKYALPQSQQNDIKISSPNLREEILELQNNSEGDELLKSLCGAFLAHTAVKVEQGNTQQNDPNSEDTSLYQMSAEGGPLLESDEFPKQFVKIFRGQIIDE